MSEVIFAVLCIAFIYAWFKCADVWKIDGERAGSLLFLIIIGCLLWRYL